MKHAIAYGHTDLVRLLVPDVLPALNAYEKRLLANNQKITAIIQLRERIGINKLGLALAKQICDEYQMQLRNR